MSNFFQKFLKNIVGDKENNKALSAHELQVPPEATNDYEAIISGGMPYFGKLNDANKQRFLKRVYNFRKIKSFHFHGLAPAEEIAILVSAAAVQVSFGLKNYRLSFFKSIYILADSYRALNAKEMFIGHVSPTGIYISWKHFVHGFSDCRDCMNVALHEMAHALHHENFIQQSGIDWDFRQDFDKLPSMFGPLMTQGIVERRS